MEEYNLVVIWRTGNQLSKIYPRMENSKKGLVQSRLLASLNWHCIPNTKCLYLDSKLICSDYNSNQN